MSLKLALKGKKIMPLAFGFFYIVYLYNFKDIKMPDFSFIPTMEVAHIGNLKQKLYVTRILWREKEVSNGKIKDGGKGFEKDKVMYLDGIEVGWWHNDVYHKEPFHSAVLVPWDIAQQGQKASDLWRYDHNIKMFKKIEIELDK